MELKQRLKTACAYKGISLAKLAEGLGISRSTFTARIKTQKFTPAEYDKMANILGAKYIYAFEFPDGTRI